MLSWFPSSNNDQLCASKLPTQPIVFIPEIHMINESGMFITYDSYMWGNLCIMIYQEKLPHM